MLTADLAQSWQRGGRTGPRLIDAADLSYLQVATDLIEIVRGHAGHARAEIDEAISEYVGVGTDYRILRGLIKLLMDRCAFETPGAVEPSEIRRQLFTKARLHHPVIGNEELRQGIITEVAQELSCPAEVVGKHLYADLPENQKLIEFEELTAGELLERYNLALAQALLYRCVELHLTVEPQDAAGYRQLFDAIKAYRLIHTIKGHPKSGYEVRLDGPVSMFHRSQKYGVQMAVFLPALLLCQGWRVRAEISSKFGTLFYELSSTQTELHSHYESALDYGNPLLEKLVAGWARRGGDSSAWTLEQSSEVIDLGESAFIPDIVLRHQAGKKIYLEVLGFWTPRYLSERLKEFTGASFKDFILIASDELRGSREPPAQQALPPNVLLFKAGVDPTIVRAAVDRFVDS